MNNSMNNTVSNTNTSNPGINTGTPMNVSVIPATRRSVQNGGQLRAQTNIRVAAYCRVSTGDESQQTSYTTQKAFYTNLITNKPGWRFAGIYADEALSGTSRAHRVEFNRMMEDAKAGKLDYIVSKSISRFARNTVDTLTCIRELRQLTPPVGVYFEKENIDTLDAKGELILTILSALAQDESRSISDNIRWTFQKKFQAGKEAYDKTFQRVKGSSVSVQRMEALEGQIKELEKKLQETIGRQVTAMREAALEQNAELNEAIARGEISIDDIELDIRNGLKANTIGTSFYNVQEEEGSEVEIYRQLSNDIRQRIESLRKEKATLEKEQGVLGIMKKNFEFFLACIKELPETNAAGMALKVNGLDV